MQAWIIFMLTDSLNCIVALIKCPALWLYEGMILTAGASGTKLFMQSYYYVPINLLPNSTF